MYLRIHVRVHLLPQVEGDIKVFKHTKKVNSLIMHYCKNITGDKSVFKDCPNLDQHTNLSVEECEKLTDNKQEFFGKPKDTSEEKPDDLDIQLRKAPVDFMIIMAKDWTKDKAWALQMYRSLMPKGCERVIAVLLVARIYGGVGWGRVEELLW